MDTWGYILVIGFGILWLATRGRAGKLASFATLGVGVGLGILIGAYWALAIFSSVFP